MAVSNGVQEWREFLESADVEIWRAIEDSILIAASDHPSEFLERRDGIAERLFTALPPSTSCECLTRSSSTVSQSHHATPPPKSPSDEDDKSAVKVKRVLAVKDEIVNRLDYREKRILELQATLNAIDEDDTAAIRRFEEALDRESNSCEKYLAERLQQLSAISPRRLRLAGVQPVLTALASSQILRWASVRTRANKLLARIEQTATTTATARPRPKQRQGVVPTRPSPQSASKPHSNPRDFFEVRGIKQLSKSGRVR